MTPRGGLTRGGRPTRRVGRTYRVRPPREETGSTLVELVVAGVVLTVVLATVGVAFSGMLRTAGRMQVNGSTAADVRRGFDTVSRGLGAASMVNAPTVVGTRTYLETLTDAVAPGAAPVCTQWRVDGTSGLLEARSWPYGTAGAATAWSTVVRGVANPGGRAPLAVLAGDDAFPRARIVVDLVVRRTGGSSFTLAATVPLENGTGTSGGLAAPEVCTEAGRP